MNVTSVYPSYKECLAQSSLKLKKSGIPFPQKEALYLLQWTCKCDYLTIISQSEKLLTQKEYRCFLDALSRRINHEPLAFIVGEKEFWSLPFYVSPVSLIPRADSETLIEAICQLKNCEESFSILDLGTGTGCLLLSLLKEYPNAYGVGIDRVEEAVQLARKNAKRHGLSQRTSFLLGNWAESLDKKFDIIISNPPYIKEDDIKNLEKDVRDYEPISALVSGKTGFEDYEKILFQSINILNKDGYLIFELGQGQKKYMMSLIKKYGYKEVSSLYDFGGIERALILMLEN